VPYLNQSYLGHEFNLIDPYPKYVKSLKYPFEKSKLAFITYGNENGAKRQNGKNKLFYLNIFIPQKYILCVLLFLPIISLPTFKSPHL
jgi:hypothetical protein